MKITSIIDLRLSINYINLKKTLSCGVQSFICVCIYIYICMCIQTYTHLTLYTYIHYKLFNYNFFYTIQGKTFVIFYYLNKSNLHVNTI